MAKFVMDGGKLLCRLCNERYRGVLEGRSTEFGQFSRRNSERFCIFWRTLEIGLLPDTEISYFIRYLTDILKLLERKSEITLFGNPPYVTMLSFQN